MIFSIFWYFRKYSPTLHFGLGGVCALWVLLLLLSSSSSSSSLLWLCVEKRVKSCVVLSSELIVTSSPPSSSSSSSSSATAAGGRVAINMTVYVACRNSSLVLSGSGQLTCQQDGSWDHNLPTCKRTSPIYLFYRVVGTLTFYGHIKSADQQTIIRWLVRWPLMGGLLYLVQRGWAWAGCGPAQSTLRCTKCNSRPINRQCTNFISFDVAI